MVDTPLVSIILPTYNGKLYIAQSIESCLTQTYENIELIIVDDGSTDETSLIIDYWRNKDSRIKTIQHKKNVGLPKSLNSGHKVCNGEYLTWTSDDNYYHRYAIQKMLQVLFQNPAIGMVYSDYYVIDAKNQIVGENKVSPIEMLSEQNVIGASFVYRRSVFNKTGYYSNRTIFAEDYDYWLRIAAHNVVFPIHETLYYYRIHGNTISSQIGKDKVRLAADFALAKNISRLKWLSKEQKIQKLMRIIKSAYLKSNYLKIPFYLLFAIMISLPLFILETSKRIKK
jgi:glycosyltransferase involved in cell wall biosynthesis